jgi:hypothetical protein
MQKVAAIVSILIVSALVAFAARAGDADEIEAINKAAAALDAAFAKDDVGTVKQMMTQGHIAVTPYYDGPQSVADQAASLPDLQYGQTIVGDVSVALLGSDTALRSFTAELNGSFKGRPLPRRVFISAIWVKQDGAWVERFYQVTALRHGDGKRGACRRLAGTYLTKNVAKGAGAGGGSVISRSLISLDPSGIALFTDSGEGGAAGFAPFTDGSGTWQCLPGEDGALTARATTLDFTEPTAEQPKAAIGRLDFEFSANIDKGRDCTGKHEVRLVEVAKRGAALDDARGLLAVLLVGTQDQGELKPAGSLPQTFEGLEAHHLWCGNARLAPGQSLAALAVIGESLRRVDEKD